MDAVATRFEFTPAARSALERVCAQSGPQVVLLTWPAGVTYLPAHHYRPGEFDVAIERLETCSVFADSRALTLFLNRRIVVDADGLLRTRPVLRVRTVSGRDAVDRHAPLLPAPDLLPPELTATALRLVDDLSAEYGGRVSESMLWSSVRTALADLKGSVLPGSLPEMASRLVHQRLDAVVLSG